MTPVVRSAGPADVADLTRCQTACYREAFGAALPGEYLVQGSEHEHRRQGAWAEFLDASGTVWIAVDAAEVVGFTSSGPSRGPAPPVPLELMTLYVRAGHHGTGLADRLLDRAIGESAAMLWVWDDNARARAYYTRHGFTADGGEKLTDAGVRLLRMVRGGC